METSAKHDEDIVKEDRKRVKSNCNRDLCALNSAASRAWVVSTPLHGRYMALSSRGKGGRLAPKSRS